MGRKVLIVLLAIGAIVGFAAGLRGHSHPHWGRHAEFERHVADVCVAAAHRVLSPKAAAPSPD